MKKIKNIITYLNFKDKIQKQYKVEVYPFYDDFHDEWHLAISDLDLYYSPEFESVIEEVAETFQEEDTCLLALSEDTIHENKIYWNYLIYFLEEYLSSLIQNTLELKVEKVSSEDFNSPFFPLETSNIVVFPKVEPKKFYKTIKQDSTIEPYNWKKAS